MKVDAFQMFDYGSAKANIDHYKQVLNFVVLLSFTNTLLLLHMTQLLLYTTTNFQVLQTGQYSFFGSQA